jgi:hypothetical protein
MAVLAPKCGCWHAARMNILGESALVGSATTILMLYADIKIHSSDYF